MVDAKKMKNVQILQGISPIAFTQMGESSKSQWGTSKLSLTARSGSQSLADEVEVDELVDSYKNKAKIGAERKGRKTWSEIVGTPKSMEGLYLTMEENLKENLKIT